MGFPQKGTGPCSCRDVRRCSIKTMEASMANVLDMRFRVVSVIAAVAITAAMAAPIFYLAAQIIL